MRARTGSEKGFALVLAVVVVALVAVAGLELSREARLSLTLASNFQERTRARMKALDGLSLAARALLDDDPAYDSLEDDWAGLGRKLREPPEEEEGGRKRVGPPEIDLEIGDLGGLFNLNLLVDQKGQADGAWSGVFKRLLELTGHDPDLLPALQDWLDQDSKTRTGGAEESEYRADGKKYLPRNAPLLDIRELGLIRGFGAEVLQGAEDRQGLAGLVAVSGASKINVNTAPLTLLRALDSGMGEGLAQAILDLRAETPIAKIGDLRRLVGMSPDLFRAVTPFLDVKSSWFGATSTGVSGRARYRIRAVLQREEKELKVIEAEIG